jgi:hypothetical protein
MLDAGVDLRDVQIAARPRRSANHHALRPSPQEPGPTPQLHPGRVHGLRHLNESSGRCADVRTARKFTETGEPGDGAARAPGRDLIPAGCCDRCPGVRRWLQPPSEGAP